MSEHYDLYASLQLDRDAEASKITEALNSRLEEFQEKNVPQDSPEVQETLAAMRIFSDPAKKLTYDARLNDPSAPPIEVSDLIALAGGGNAQASAPVPAAPKLTELHPAPALPDNPKLTELTRGLPAAVAASAIVSTVIGGLSFLVLALISLTGFSHGVSGGTTSSLGGLQQYISGASDLLVYFGSLVMITFPLILVFYGIWSTLRILKGRSNTSWWALLFVTITLVFLLFPLTLVPGAGAMGAILGILGLIAQIIVLCLPDTRAWFEGKVRVSVATPGQ